MLSFLLPMLYHNGGDDALKEGKVFNCLLNDAIDGAILMLGGKVFHSSIVLGMKLFLNDSVRHR